MRIDTAELPPDTKFSMGDRFMTRSGARVRILRINPDDRWPFLLCTIELTADGRDLGPDSPLRLSLCPDGRYFPHDERSPLDLIARVPSFSARAA